MDDDNPNDVSDEAVEQVLRKTGFEVVGKPERTRQTSRPHVGTPDVPTLRSKARELGAPLSNPEETAMSDTDALMKKFLKGGGASDNDAPAARSKSRGRIVNVRAIEADSIAEDERPPKDLRIVVDDKGKLGESS